MADRGQRFGIGFDSHPADASRTLRLAGVVFEGEPGLAGHSDADVVCHALADAMFGACALADVGQHFPDTDPRWANVSGLDLLARATEVVFGAGFSPASCDVVVISERAAIAPRRDAMRDRLAGSLGIERGRVSVKGKRPEGLVLEEGAVACLALAVVVSR